MDVTLRGRYVRGLVLQEYTGKRRAGGPDGLKADVAVLKLEKLNMNVDVDVDVDIELQANRGNERERRRAKSMKLNGM